MKKLPIALVVVALALVAAGAWWFKSQPGNGDALVLYGNVDIRQI